MKDGRKMGAASADAPPPIIPAAPSTGPPPGLGVPGVGPASGPAPLGSRAGSSTSSASGAPEVWLGFGLSRPCQVCVGEQVAHGYRQSCFHT